MWQKYKKITSGFFPMAVLILLISCKGQEKEQIEEHYNFKFQNPSLSTKERIDDLIGQLTLEEKISLMTNESDSIPRLGIPYYNWWNEGLHGVARSAPATVFPQAIGMAATFDPELVEKVAAAISDEGRALYHASIKKGVHKKYLGLTYWSPNINIFRDPRWGRGHETYGEDPFLTGELGAAFVKGLQGNDKKYLKLAACAKHFAVHNGPENLRHKFNAISNQKDLNETYLPAFKRLIDVDVAGVMCAYNRTNDEACCSSPTLLIELLRKNWNFKGYVVSDCGALNDLHANHKVTSNIVESAALAIKSDINVNCGQVYKHLKKAIEQGLLTESELNSALAKQLEIRFRLGMFDPDEKVPYSTIPISKVRSGEHIALARKMAQKSIVLLKNNNNVLPLDKNVEQIYVTGNNSADLNALMGNYYGVSKNYVTILEGIASAVSNTTIVQYNQGFLVEQETEGIKTGQAGNAKAANVTIAVIGLNPLYEGEDGDTPFSKTGGDRSTIELPENQLVYLRKLREKIGDKPLIVVVCSGSAIAMPEVDELADAIVWAWYPGEQGGNAVADVLFGDYQPSGKLPITIYKSTNQLGDFEDYTISQGGRTYRYFKDEPLYPFGFGLSYNKIIYEQVGETRFTMSGNPVTLALKLKNNGKSRQEETVQLYVSKPDAPFPTPLYALKAIKKVSLKAGEEKQVEFQVLSEMLGQIDMAGKKVLPPGEYNAWIGPACPSEQAIKLGSPAPINFTITVQ